MFKIKLLILLFSLFFISCVSQYIDPKNKFVIAYIGGGEDGLILKNYLTTNLKASNLYDNSSRFIINANIKHDLNLYIVNLNKTSDREKINSTLSITIKEIGTECIVFEYLETKDQFYVIAEAEKYISNNKAIEKIKLTNTELLVDDFVSEIFNTALKCQDA